MPENGNLISATTTPTTTTNFYDDDDDNNNNNNIRWLKHPFHNILTRAE